MLFTPQNIIKEHFTDDKKMSKRIRTPSSEICIAPKKRKKPDEAAEASDDTAPSSSGGAQKFYSMVVSNKKDDAQNRSHIECEMKSEKTHFRFRLDDFRFRLDDQIP